KESDATRKLYGLDDSPTQYFGRQALMARRLVERGVRFVQLYSGGGNFEPSWDAHFNLKGNHGTHAAETDKPIAALLEDLKGRGLLDSTLIVWHGEFGRLPISQRMDGRGHNAYGFSVWLAGGGVKAARWWALPTNTAIARWRIQNRSTICTLRFCICSGSTSRN